MSEVKMKALTTFDDSAVGLVREGATFTCSDSRARHFERNKLAVPDTGKGKGKKDPLAAKPASKPVRKSRRKAGGQTGATDPSS